MNFAQLDELSDTVIGSAIRIHRKFGPGMFESVYERLLYESLRSRGLDVRRQQTVSFSYNNMEFRNAFRVDMIIENELLIEVKAVETMRSLYQKQVLTYLRLLQLRAGLVLNFGCETLREGLKRVANDYQFDADITSRLEPEDPNAPPTG